MIIVTIIHDDDAPWDCEGRVFKGDELTSPTHEAIEFLREQQQKEMVV